jgi:putative peptidoglycan lipid II flippase
MAVATMTSRLLGLVREQLIAFYFGASFLTDLYHVAYRVPNLMRDLFAEGAFSSAFVPEFVNARQQSALHSKRLFGSVSIVLGLLLLTLCFVMAFNAEFLVKTFAPKLVADPQNLDLGAQLVRIMSPFLFFISLSALMMGVLNSLGHFFIPALSPAVFNCVFIFVLISGFHFELYRPYSPVYLLGMGVLIGGAVQSLFQLPLLYKHGYRLFYPFGQFLKTETKNILVLLGPGLLGFAFNQVNLLVQTILATASGVGALTWLNFAFRLFQLPIGIFSVSVGNSHLVQFSSGIKSGDTHQAEKALSESLFLSNALILPPMVYLLVFHSEVVELIFFRGAFTLFDVTQTGQALFFYAIGLPAYGMYKILVPSFYSFGKPRVPVIVSSLCILLNIAFCWIGLQFFSFWILALGTSLSMILNSILLFFFLSRMMRVHLFSLIFGPRMIKIFLSLVPCLALHILLKRIFETPYENWLQLLLGQLIYIATIMLSFHITLYTLGERTLIRALFRKLKK